MGHWHVEVLLTVAPSGAKLRVVLCVPWEDLFIHDEVLVLRGAVYKQGPLLHAFAPGEWSQLKRVEHEGDESDESDVRN